MPKLIENRCETLPGIRVWCMARRVGSRVLVRDVALSLDMLELGGRDYAARVLRKARREVADMVRAEREAL